MRIHVVRSIPRAETNNDGGAIPVGPQGWRGPIFQKEANVILNSVLPLKSP
jgi:hypothetical protein